MPESILLYSNHILLPTNGNAKKRFALCTRLSRFHGLGASLHYDGRRRCFAVAVIIVGHRVRSWRDWCGTHQLSSEGIVSLIRAWCSAWRSIRCGLISSGSSFISDCKLTDACERTLCEGRVSRSSRIDSNLRLPTRLAIRRAINLAGRSSSRRSNIGLCSIGSLIPHRRLRCSCHNSTIRICWWSRLTDWYRIE